MNARFDFRLYKQKSKYTSYNRSLHTYYVNPQCATFMRSFLLKITAILKLNFLKQQTVSLSIFRFLSSSIICCYLSILFASALNAVFILQGPTGLDLNIEDIIQGLKHTSRSPSISQCCRFFLILFLNLAFLLLSSGQTNFIPRLVGFEVVCSYVVAVNVNIFWNVKRF